MHGSYVPEATSMISEQLAMRYITYMQKSEVRMYFLIYAPSFFLFLHDLNQVWGRAFPQNS